jgi:predicted ester cyclase
MTTEESRAALMRVMQAAALAGDLATAVEQHVSSAVIVHMPNGDVGQGQAAAGFLTEGYEAFPDLTLTLEAVSVENDRAAIQFTMKGTHTGVFRGFAPTKKAVSLPICTVLRFDDGVIAEIWYYANLYAPLVATLGASHR